MAPGWERLVPVAQIPWTVSLHGTGACFTVSRITYIKQNTIVIYGDINYR